jgi:superfamily II DNA or RNA helicase
MKRMTEKVLIKTDPALKNRLYQVESLMNILNLESEKCLVKMFCGTGKSRIITNVIIHEKKTLNVIVFPSLALINQYSMDYLNNDEYKKHFKKHKKINISSEILTTTESTTDPKKIKNFLKLKTHKIILVTYQSYQVLLNCLDGMKIGLVCYDEAHHVVSPEYQKLVFETDYFEKEVFFTATPRNENGIIMYDVDEPENNMCGELAYDYTYLQGLNDEVLNSFEVCIDMYTENSNNSIYQALARAILARNTSRVLSFHSGVNGESNTNVWNFVNYEIFQAVFSEVQRNEFPEKEGYYTKITFKGIDGEIPSSVRKAMLLELDETPDNEIYIISSCETIGEGVDTKNANMCLFADPKTSVVKIIQNIGRVVRRNKNHPLSTVLIPCWINMENYAEANGDTEKQDELIRQQMRMPNGDYASILNVLGALKQEDPELYEMCLNNHSNRRHKEKSLEKQKFQILDDEEDEFYETYDSEEVQQMKEEGEIPLEIHTNETIERFNEDVDDELLLRLYHDEENNIYKPIIRTDEEVDDRQIIQPPTKATSNVKMSIHQNDDIQMLWSVSSELDFSKKFCSAIIACEVSYGVEQWCLTLQQVCKYMDDNKKAPSTHDKNSEIKKFGRWVSNKKTSYAKKTQIMSNPEIRSKWEETLEKYKEYLCDADEQWHLTHQQVCKYMDDNKKRPSENDENCKIKKLGRWVSHQKKSYAKNRYIMSNPEIRSKWEATLEKYKEYLCCADEQWCLTLQQVCKYMDDKKKAPSKHDENSEIKKLGHWVSDQKKKYSKTAYIMKNPEIRTKWEVTLENYKEYLCIDLDEQWHLTHQKVCKYMDDNKKRPSTTDEKPEIRKLGNWVSNQKKNYAKNRYIMKNSEIRTKWEETLEKYKDYLKQEIIPIQSDEPKPEEKFIIKIKNKKKIIKKQKTIIPTSSNADISTIENQTTHHFPQQPSDIGQLHKTYLRMRSDNLHQKFKENPQLWQEYHAIRKKTFAHYDHDSIPSNIIIRKLEKIKTKHKKIVVDMGCGQAPIAHHFLEKNDPRFTFHNYDHISGGDTIIQEVNISHLTEEDSSVDIAIMSLALWGTQEDCTQYIKEAYRILESGGKFYICDSTKRWSPELMTQENGGELLRKMLMENGFTIIHEEIGNPFCLFECYKNY